MHRNVNRELNITENTSITSIQEAFRSLFPYLSIRFFSAPQKPGEPVHLRSIENSEKTLKQLRKKNSPGDITITPETVVADLENKFNNLYGIEVQVYRQSGKAWLETTLTDSWTLDEQNQQGEALSKIG